MPLIFVSSDPSVAAPSPAKKRTQWIRVLAAGLALSIASTSAALLIRVAQVETADQAMLEALRQSPGFEHVEGSSGRSAAAATGSKRTSTSVCCNPVRATHRSVSYTHLTLPTSDLV